MRECMHQCCVNKIRLGPIRARQPAYHGKQCEHLSILLQPATYTPRPANTTRRSVKPPNDSQRAVTKRSSENPEHRD